MKTIFISGGTGFLAKALIPYLLKKYNPDSIRLFARNDYKMAMILREYNDLYKYNKLRPMIGDACDRSRVFSVIDGCDLVICAHAMKRVEIASYNPQEAVKVNVMGSINVMDACLQLKIPKMVFISSDKAVNAFNLYGRSKAIMESVIIDRAKMLGDNNPIMCITRYGNLITSTGAAIPYFIDKIKKNEEIPITDTRMTRFLLTKREAVEIVGRAIDSGKQGEIVLPKELRSVNILEAVNWLIQYFNSTSKIKMIGMFSGEKLHEEIIEGGLNSGDYLIGRDVFFKLLKEEGLI